MRKTTVATIRRILALYFCFGFGVVVLGGVSAQQLDSPLVGKKEQGPKDTMLQQSELTTASLAQDSEETCGHTADGTVLVARAAICATGVEYRRLGLANEVRFTGAGIYYGAGASEASFCLNEDIVLVGGGNSAGQAALHFARVARKVTMIVRGDALRGTLSAYLIDRIYSTPNIGVLTNTEVTAVNGDECLTSITLTNRRTGESKTFETGRLSFVSAASLARIGL